MSFFCLSFVFYGHPAYGWKLAQLAFADAVVPPKSLMVDSDVSYVL